MPVIDTHCHLDQYPDPLAIGHAAERSGITVIAMTGLPSHYLAGRMHVSALKKVRLALGLHPLLAKRHEGELRLFEAYLPTTSYVGEIGLDFSSHGRETRTLQIKSFQFVLGLLSSCHKFISLHSRGAEGETLAMLKDFNIPQATFHWFSGPIRIAEQAVAEGYYFSINPAMMRSKSGQQLVARIPPELILTETDGPYVHVDRRPAIPEDIFKVTDMLATVWKVDREEARVRLWANCKAAVRRIKRPDAALLPK